MSFEFCGYTKYDALLFSDIRGTPNGVSAVESGKSFSINGLPPTIYEFIYFLWVKSEAFSTCISR